MQVLRHRRPAWKLVADGGQCPRIEQDVRDGEDFRLRGEDGLTLLFGERTHQSTNCGRIRIYVAVGSFGNRSEELRGEFSGQLVRLGLGVERRGVDDVDASVAGTVSIHATEPLGHAIEWR